MCGHVDVFGRTEVGGTAPSTAEIQICWGLSLPQRNCPGRDTTASNFCLQHLAHLPSLLLLCSTGIVPDQCIYPCGKMSLPPGLGFSFPSNCSCRAKGISQVFCSLLSSFSFGWLSTAETAKEGVQKKPHGQVSLLQCHWSRLRHQAEGNESACCHFQIGRKYFFFFFPTFKIQQKNRDLQTMTPQEGCLFLSLTPFSPFSWSVTIPIVQAPT